MPPQTSEHRPSDAGEAITEYLLIFAPLVAIIALGILTILMSRSV